MTRRITVKPSHLVKWDPKQEGLIARYVQEYLDILYVDTDGKVKTSELFKNEALVEILSHHVELHEVSVPNVKRALIRRAFFTRLKKYKTQSLHTFRRALAAEVRRYLRLPAQEYWLLFPLHVAHGQLKDRRSFSVLGTRLLIRSWEYVRRRFDLERFLQLTPRLQASISLETNFTPVLALAEGKDWDDVFNEADRAFDLFRWLLNLVYQFNTIHPFGQYRKPLGRIFPPPVYVAFKSSGECVQHFSNTAKFPEYPENDVPDDKFLQARNLAKMLWPPKSDDDTVLLIVEALEKYGQALDTTEWRLAFLLLWQILELLTLQPVKQFSMKKVTDRVKILMPQNRLAADLLSPLYETRNALVHRGHFSEAHGLRDLDLLAYIVEDSIKAIFAQLRYLPTRGRLAEFYDQSPGNDQELADRQRAIAYIQRRRAKAKGR